MITCNYFVILINLIDIACVRLDEVTACEVHYFDES